MQISLDRLHTAACEGDPAAIAFAVAEIADGLDRGELPINEDQAFALAEALVEENALDAAATIAEALLGAGYDWPCLWRTLAHVQVEKHQISAGIRLLEGLLLKGGLSQFERFACLAQLGRAYKSRYAALRQAPARREAALAAWSSSLQNYRTAFDEAGAVSPDVDPTRSLRSGSLRIRRWCGTNLLLLLREANAEPALAVPEGTPSRTEIASCLINELTPTRVMPTRLGSVQGS